MLVFDNTGFNFEALVGGTGGLVEATVITDSKDAERYWGVLEFGSRRGQRPWPNARERTAYGPDGRVYSSQAVGGFVRVNDAIIFGFLKDEYDRLPAGIIPDKIMLASAVNRAAQRTCGLLQKIVPVDSGEFRDSIIYVRAN